MSPDYEIMLTVT